MTETMKITAIAPWFGGKRTLAPEIVRQLGPHSYYFEPCAGSMAVLFAKPPSSHELVCDLHGALTNLALCVQNDQEGPRLFAKLQRIMYSDSVYRKSKEWLDEAGDQYEGQQIGMPDEGGIQEPFSCPDLNWACHYFIASWMGRNGVAGTARVNYQIATRWTQGGGSGPTRFRAAVDSIPAWCERLKNVHILRRDMFAVLPKVEDAAGTAIYADPPYLAETRGSHSDGRDKSATARYVHDFAPEQHQRLADELRRFKKARVVVSYYDSPKLAELYPGWTKIDCSRHKHLHVQNKRGMGRIDAPEVLLVNGEAFADPAPQKYETGLFAE